MTSYAPLVAEAERLLEQDHLDPDEVIELARQVRSMPRGDQVTGRKLLALIGTLTKRTASEIETLDQALKQDAASRKALSGYGFVKPERKRQRANKVR